MNEALREVDARPELLVYAGINNISPALDDDMHCVVRDRRLWTPVLVELWSSAVAWTIASTCSRCFLTTGNPIWHQERSVSLCVDLSRFFLLSATVGHFKVTLLQNKLLLDMMQHCKFLSWDIISRFLAHLELQHAVFTLFMFIRWELRIPIYFEDGFKAWRNIGIVVGFIGFAFFSLTLNNQFYSVLCCLHFCWSTEFVWENLDAKMTPCVLSRPECSVIVSPIVAGYSRCGSIRLGLETCFCSGWSNLVEQFVKLSAFKINFKTYPFSVFTDK